MVCECVCVCVFAAVARLCIFPVIPLALAYIILIFPSFAFVQFLVLVLGFIFLNLTDLMFFTWCLFTIVFVLVSRLLTLVS